MAHIKSLAQLVEEALVAVAIDVDGKKMIDVAILADTLKKVQLISNINVQVAVLPDGPPDPGKGK